jgi:hypothetical protein
MSHWTTPIVGLLALFAGSAAAVAADAPAKPVGTWTRNLGENSIKFDIKADNLAVTLTDGSKNTLQIDCSYTIKDGVLSLTVKKVERKGIDGGPGEGDTFSFRFKVDKDKLTISDLKGTDSDEAKQLVEGDYKKEK